MHRAQKRGARRRRTPLRGVNARAADQHPLFASLPSSGFLDDNGSLYTHGFLPHSGSLHYLGFLPACGSLSRSGFLSTFGSLSFHGFLKIPGSLSRSGFLCANGSLYSTWFHQKTEERGVSCTPLQHFIVSMRGETSPVNCHDKQTEMNLS